MSEPIPREGVEALLAKVRRRMAETETMASDCAAVLRDELSDVAWKLAPILEVPHVE